MLDRIQQAFGARLRSEQKVRQFAADASHELRTPLTTIRGYAELYRQGALGPDQLPDAMRRIEQEAQRMSTLVAELLELARLDRTSSLDLAETDLAGAGAGRGRGRRGGGAGPAGAGGGARTGWSPWWTRRASGRCWPTCSATSASTPRRAPRSRCGWPRSAAGWCSRSRTRARACPRRTRPGRSTGSTAARTRGTAAADGRRPIGPGRRGSGLGLSIVQAIAAAHGGQAVLESQPGYGTRVRIWLPAESPAS